MADKILVVDDDEIIKLVVCEELNLAGYDSATADDGQAAWEMLDASPSAYDLILLDKNMPRLDGLSLIRRLMADTRLCNIPVVLLTSDSSQQDVVDGLAAGAYYYLTKPFTGSVLSQVIRNTLQQSREKRELGTLVGQSRTALGIMRRAEFRFRSLNEAKELALWLADASPDPGRTVNGYSELLINAVEHGNLGITYAEKGRLLSNGLWLDEIESRLNKDPYRNREITVMMEKSTAAFSVRICDQGEGFDWHDYVEFRPERAYDLHGRGIAMSKAMSFDVLEYKGCGNEVFTLVRAKTAI